MIADQEQEVAYLPFHAINQYMLEEFRTQMVGETLRALPALSRDHRAGVEKWTKKIVKVHGFRNSAKAPVGMRLKPTVDGFIKNPDLAAAILHAWAETEPTLRAQMFELLTAREWDHLLPVEADRTQLPGFQTDWPEGEDFDSLIEAFQARFPEGEVEENKISLMAVWVSGRLPLEES